MGTFDPAEYGIHVADIYDEVYAGLSPDAAVGCLAGLADGGAVLELGIGTGRIALPLAATGLVVEGVDGSPEMVAQLRRKPGGERLRVEVGDFATTAMGRRYALVTLPFNTINALPTQEAQCRPLSTPPRIWNRAAPSSWRTGFPTSASSVADARSACTRSAIVRYSSTSPSCTLQSSE